MTSVIIVTYNNLETCTIPCIESIRRHSDGAECEIVVVDNGSTDGTVEYIKDLANSDRRVRLVCLGRNSGFAAGNNAGIRASSGDYLVLLNNDTLVTPGWITKLTKALDSAPDIGLVGPLTNSAGTEQKVDLDGLASGNYVDVTGTSTYFRSDLLYDTRRLGFFCVGFRRDLVEKIGVLDERFGLGMFEDDDFCLRAIRAGYRLVIVQDVFVFHRGSASFSKMSGTDYERLFENNRNVFFHKHGTWWTFGAAAIARLDRVRFEIENPKLFGPDVTPAIAARLKDLRELLEILGARETRERSRSQGAKTAPLRKAAADLLRRALRKIKKTGMGRSATRILDLLRGKRVGPYGRVSLLAKRRVIIRESGTARNREFSFVCTVLNERKTIDVFLDCLLRQSLPATELILVDGGSTDGTYEYIEGLAHRYPRLRLLREPRANISRGRNVGIAASSQELIILMDAGCEVAENYFELIMSGFNHRKIDMVFGISVAARPIEETSLIPRWDKVDLGQFLPSGRSMAIRKTLWAKCGGFPEHLTLTGEDTLFDLKYRLQSARWCAMKGAVISWHAPTTRADAFRLFYRYGVGDGESGVGDYRFHAALVHSIVNGEPGRHDAPGWYFAGYLEGWRNRAKIEVERQGIKRLAIVVSEYALEDRKLVRGYGNTRDAKIVNVFLRPRRMGTYRESHIDPYRLNLIEYYQVDEFVPDAILGRYRGLIHPRNCQVFCLTESAKAAALRQSILAMAEAAPS